MGNSFHNQMTAPNMSYLDFLIQDCLKAYADDYVPSSTNIPSPVTASSVQPTQSDFPQGLEKNIFGTDSIEMVSPVSPVDAQREAHSQYVCEECNKSYPGKRQLKRHRHKHKTPDKYMCTIDGCEKTSYRMDAMRSHVKAHEKRILVLIGHYNEV
jgi:hypothetical protein